jgi:signal transduction histidine kinase
LLISVADTGSGMDAATLGRSVEPFFTTKPIGQGTGLGLPMAKGFTEQSGGAFAMSSVPGEGTRVDLLLPVAREDARPAGAGEGSREGPLAAATPHLVGK